MLVERSLDRPHQIKLDRALVAGQLKPFALTDSVLRADAAAKSVSVVMDDMVDLSRPSDRVVVVSLWNPDVEVQIAAGHGRPIGIAELRLSGPGGGAV